MIVTDGASFKDENGRTIMLRGINLGGNSKNPFHPNGESHRLDGFYDHRNVSFVGRPFPLEEAEEHFNRLKTWGFNFIRLLVTWEAIEHRGPGIYDEDYLDYLAEVIRLAGIYGFYISLDPHQDCWSRFSGGDGAPGWTLEALGMDITRISETGAAILHNQNRGPLPRMVWPSNYQKLACATMFTIFFAGNDFASKTMILGEPAQEYLQRHFIKAFKQLAQKVAGLPNVLGFDTLNEPSPGYIGWEHLEYPHEILRNGPSPSPLQSMACASGYPQKVGVWNINVLGVLKHGSIILNPDGHTLWKDGFHCIWQEHGVWDINKRNKAIVLKKDYFTNINGHKVNFWNDYVKPFFMNFSNEIRTAVPEAMIFYEISPQQKMPDWVGETSQNVVNATHWYDTATLVTKRYMSWISIDYRTIRLVIGATKIREMFVHQLSDIKKWGDRSPNGSVPTLVGEFGIPFDLANKYAYRTGDFSQQEKALDAYFSAMEINLLNCALWNYTPNNNNLFGDLWYEEDFSIFSRDQQLLPSDIYSGGRALRAAIRPYPRMTSGDPLFLSFNMKKRVFKFKFRGNSAIKIPTEIFCPEFQYPDGYSVEISDGRYETDRSSQILRYYPSNEKEIHSVLILPDQHIKGSPMA